jgi:hypothetical protein
MLFIPVGAAQVTMSVSAAGNPYIEGDTAVIKCTFDTLSSGATMSLVSVDRDIGGGFASVLTYNVSDDSTVLGSYSSGVVTGQLPASGNYYDVTLPNMQLGDAGTYRCNGEDSAGSTPSTPPTVSIVVQAAPG